jgi:hypothetical protein
VRNGGSRFGLWPDASVESCLSFAFAIDCDYKKLSKKWTDYFTKVQTLPAETLKSFQSRSLSVTGGPHRRFEPQVRAVIFVLFLLRSCH